MRNFKYSPAFYFDMIIGKGAEATVCLDGHVTKKRDKKSYRIEAIDSRLRKFRTRREAKILARLADLDFPAPRLISTDRLQTIEMGYISGQKLRDVLTKDNCTLMRALGKDIAMLHNNGIIHGDLTTSNFLIDDKLYLIDFGLSFFSEKIEDKAVDLHLLRQALESKHNSIWKRCFDQVLEGYHGAQDYEKILERLAKVEKRGRYKKKSLRADTGAKSLL